MSSLLSVEVTPAVATLAPGASASLVAIGLYEDGERWDLTDLADWGTSDTEVARRASNSARGLCIAKAPGRVQVIARVGELVGVCELTVEEASP